MDLRKREEMKQLQRQTSIVSRGGRKPDFQAMRSRGDAYMASAKSNGSQNFMRGSVRRRIPKQQVVLAEGGPSLFNVDQYSPQPNKNYQVRVTPNLKQINY